jgi:hypothetical protein
MLFVKGNVEICLEKNSVPIYQTGLKMRRYSGERKTDLELQSAIYCDFVTEVWSSKSVNPHYVVQKESAYKMTHASQNVLDLSPAIKDVRHAPDNGGAGSSYKVHMLL